MNERAIDMHMKSRQQYHGERASKMLSHQLKRMAAANYIPAVGIRTIISSQTNGE